MMNKKILQYGTYVVVGFIMMSLTLSKLLFNFHIDSDWFWFIAWVALVVEGSIDPTKEKKFNRKYKVISKKEFEELWSKIEDTKDKK